MQSKDLICLGTITEPRTDIKQSVEFIAAWNTKYPGYHAHMHRNPHDFGTYMTVAVPEEKFIKGMNDSETFGVGGIEDAAIALAEELHLDY